jgi:hypothetical protein
LDPLGSLRYNKRRRRQRGNISRFLRTNFLFEKRNDFYSVADDYVSHELKVDMSPDCRVKKLNHNEYAVFEILIQMLKFRKLLSTQNQFSTVAL